jgi:hypothetical protein
MSFWGTNDHNPAHEGASRISIISVGGKLVPSVAAALVHGVLGPVIFPNLQKVIDGEHPDVAEMMEAAYEIGVGNQYNIREADDISNNCVPDYEHHKADGWHRFRLLEYIYSPNIVNVFGGAEVASVNVKYSVEWQVNEGA